MKEPVIRVLTCLIAIGGVVLLVLACAPRTRSITRPASAGVSPTKSVGQQLTPTFLAGGWIIPKGERPGPFAETLRGVVIFNEKELRAFLDGIRLIRPRGNFDTLSETNFSQVVILASYYLWRPLRGDPLSFEKITLKGTEVGVNVRLLEADFGKERPYLLAPMSMVILEKKSLPQGVPLRFVFLLNGKVAAEAVHTLQ